MARSGRVFTQVRLQCMDTEDILGDAQGIQGRVSRTTGYIKDLEEMNRALEMKVTLRSLDQLGLSKYRVN